MSWIEQVFVAVGQMLSLQMPAAFTAPEGGVIAIGVVLVAALSTVLGQVAVFSLNRIAGWRLVVSIAAGTLLATGARIGLAFALGGVVWAVSGGQASVRGVALSYAFALAPYGWGFLVFIPHLGLGISRVLEVWTLVCLAVMASSVLPQTGMAIAAAFGVWLVGAVASRWLAAAFSGVIGRLWTRVTGRPTLVTPQDLLSGAPFIPVSLAQVKP